MTRTIRRALFLMKHGDQMRDVADECHRLFALASKEKNAEQFEAYRRDHAAKAAEYAHLMQELESQ